MSIVPHVLCAYMWVYGSTYPWRLDSFYCDFDFFFPFESTQIRIQSNSIINTEQTRKEKTKTIYVFRNKMTFPTWQRHLTIASHIALCESEHAHSPHHALVQSQNWLSRRTTNLCIEDISTRENENFHSKLMCYGNDNDNDEDDDKQSNWWQNQNESNPLHSRAQYRDIINTYIYVD